MTIAATQAEEQVVISGSEMGRATLPPLAQRANVTWMTPLSATSDVTA
jgi:hypothetical protein